MYAEVNGKLNYAKGINNNQINGYQNNYQNNHEINYSNSNRGFDSLTQSINNKQADDNYYCGGKSSLALRGMQVNNTSVSIAFFSNKNISLLQKCIKREIFKRSKGEYLLEEDQDESDLLLVMRSIYLEFSRHLPTNIDKQVSDLNRYTLREIIPGMMTNIDQQIGYLRDISQPIQPIALPLNVNNGGRKSLPSVTNLWLK